MGVRVDRDEGPLHQRSPPRFVPFVCRSFQGPRQAVQDEPVQRLDLNLLAIFDMVMSERSLTRAGKRLGMTQSAVSHALSRLRDAAGDPLFERTGRGVRPTARAVEMSGEIREALDRLRATMRQRGDGFCCHSAERTFLLDIPAGIEAILVPEIARRTAGAAGLRFRISGSRAQSIMHELRSGETWLALDYEPPQLPGYRSELLAEDTFVVMARRGNPLYGSGMPLADFEAIPQVAFAFRRELSPVSQRYEACGVRRTIKYSLPSVVSVAMLVEATDMISVMPSKIARSLARCFALELHPCPVVFAPMPIYMVWHDGFDRDEGHVWLRGVLKDVCEAL